MEFEGFKSAWQKRPVEGHALSGTSGVSRSIEFLRTSAIRDRQRSEDTARVVFCFLFALLAVAVSIVVMPPGAGRIAAWLFALALFVECFAGFALVAQRFRAPATDTILDFVSRECRQIETRLRLETYTQRLTVILIAIALLVMLFSPRPLSLRENALDALERMAILTAFLGFAWSRSKSRTREVRTELDRYRKDLSK
jgi:hypothetical protein